MGNSLGVLIAGAAGIAIALALLGARSLGGRLLARDGADLQWRTIFARALARTNLFFITLCRSEEHTSELQSLMRISYAVFCLKKKKHNKQELPKQTYTV